MINLGRWIHWYQPSCFRGHRPEAGCSFSMFLRFGFMCVVVHVRCCLPCQVARGGWGVGGVITSLPTVRSGHVRYVFEVYMCVVDALPAGFTGGCIGVSRCINACDNCWFWRICVRLMRAPTHGVDRFYLLLLCCHDGRYCVRLMAI